MSPPRPTVSLALLGLSTAVSQVVLLREAMAALGGSELAWGSVLALWLVGMGAGSRLGVRLGGGVAAAIAPAAVVVLASVGVLLFRAAPTLLGAASGEALTTWDGAWLWIAAVLPPGVAGGVAFPVLAGELGSFGSGRAYAIEATGALVGGLLFSFALAPFGAAIALTSVLGVVVAASLYRTHRLVAAALLVAFVAAGFPASRSLSRHSWLWTGRPDALAAWTETRHQRLELSRGTPAALYANGRLLASYPDPFLTTPRAHMLMLLHPDPGRVLAVGAVADGSAVTMLDHPVRLLHLAEEDPALAHFVASRYGPSLEQALADPRVRLAPTDPLRALRQGQVWDMVLLLDGDPTTIRHNRTRTLEFFSECRQVMAPRGILVVRTGISDTYLGGGAGRLLAVLSSTMLRVFPAVVAIPGESVILLAANDPDVLCADPAELTRRWRARRLADPVFVPEMLELLIDPSRFTELNRHVSAANAPPNTAARPRAVVLATGLSEARTQPSLLTAARALERRSANPLAIATAAVALALLLLATTRRSPGTAAAAVVGFSSMAWWLLLLVTWQSAIGSVYAEVGALSAGFMAGLAAGALVARRWHAPQRWLAPLLVAGTCLSALIAAGLPSRAPLLAVPTLLVAGGLLTGAAFAGVAHLAARGETRRGAGLGFAADEAGAALAALVVGLIALPWAGLTATATGLAVVELAMVPAVVRAVRRERAGTAEET